MHRLPDLPILLLVFASGCGSGGEMGMPDAGEVADAGGDQVMPPTPPDFGPCPDGWRSVEEDGLTLCEPEPVDAVDCAAGTARFLGDEGCGPVGPPCPSGDFPDDLPAGASLLYVLPSASGGDGTVGAPFGAIDMAFARARPGTVIVLGKGTHDGMVEPPANVTLWGACAAETRLISSIPSDRFAIVEILRPGIVMKNVTVGDSDRPAVLVTASMVDAELEAVIVRDVPMFGLAVGVGALTARDLVVRDIRPDVLGQGGRGMQVAVGATAEFSRVNFERVHDVGVLVGEGSDVRMTDLVIRGTRPELRDGVRGRALTIQDSNAALERVLLDDNLQLGALLGRDSTVTLSDFVVRDTGSEMATGLGGRGLALQDHAVIELSRGRVERNRDIGIHVGNATTELSATDVLVRDTDSERSTQRLGRGLSSQEGARLTLNRVQILRSRDVGLSASGAGAVVQLTDVAVADTRSQELDGRFGRGVSAQLGVTLSGTRVAIDRSRGVGLMATSEATIELSHVAVRTVLRRACAESDCAEFGFGMGVGAYYEGAVHLSDFLVSEASLCAVQVATGSSLDLLRGEVANSQIGACVQIDGYMISRLTDQVRYRDNETPVDGTLLPVPEPSAAAEPSSWL